MSATAPEYLITTRCSNTVAAFWRKLHKAGAYNPYTKSLASPPHEDGACEHKSLKLLCFGNSQWPLIRDGSLVEITPAAERKPAEGDLVAYRSGDRVICHRLLRRRIFDAREEYLMKGDSNPTADGWIQADSVLGRVARVNGRDLDLGWRKVLSRGLFLHSRLQSACHLYIGGILPSGVVRKLGRSKLLVRVMNPWLLLKRGDSSL